MNIKLLKTKGTYKSTVNFFEHTDCGDKSLGIGELWEYITQKDERSFWVIFKKKIYYAMQMSDDSFTIKSNVKLPQHVYTADILKS